jgi:dihydroxy-acid dehydratase
MSGTSYGCCVLHVAPESFVGGPLALVKNGDLIELDVEKRELNLKVSAPELAQRKSAWKAPVRKYERSYGAIFSRHVKQADEGCDFDFLEGTAPVPDPEIH